MAEEVKPSDVSGEVGFFDRFAAAASSFAARTPFFVFCALLVILWLIGLPFAGPTNDIYHLALNSPTTAITFLLVALFQNTASREAKAQQKKLNAIADAVADLIEFQAIHAETADDCDRLRVDAEELRAAVGLEHRTTA